MKIYNIDPEEYFKNIYTEEKTYKDGFIDVADTMFQLIYHFNLYNKKIFSIGSGWGLQEFWMYKKGCRLTFVDIDLSNVFDSYLNTLKLEGSMRYIIGDIYEIVKEFEEKYDLLYISGMVLDMTWNKEKNGFSDLIFECIERFLLDKGLFICQHSHGGIKMNDPISVYKIKEQCKQEGLFLISIYHFLDYSHVSLITIFKGSEEELKEYMESIKGNIEITNFHGRSTMERIIKKVYQYD